MALEVLHQQAATHENEQFRRVVKIVDAASKSTITMAFLLVIHLMRNIGAFVQMRFSFSIME